MVQVLIERSTGGHDSDTLQKWKEFVQNLTIARARINEVWETNGSLGVSKVVTIDGKEYAGYERTFANPRIVGRNATVFLGRHTDADTHRNFLVEGRVSIPGQENEPLYKDTYILKPEIIVEVGHTAPMDHRGFDAGDADLLNYINALVNDAATLNPVGLVVI